MLPKETDYKEFTAQIAGVLPPQSRAYLYGYPSVFWGLRDKNRELSFVEGVLLDRQKAGDVIAGVDYVILTRGLDPGNDDRELGLHRAVLEEVCLRNNARLMLIANVGVKRRFAYSAEIYRVMVQRRAAM